MPENTTRRTVLKRTTGLAAVGSVAVAGCLGNGDDDADPEAETITIGALQPTSGDLEYYGESSLMGFYCGFAYKYDASPADVGQLTPGTYEFDPDDGPTYEIILEDTELSPDTAQSVAEDLVIDHDADLLWGGTLSEVARRIIGTVVSEADVPYVIGPAADADITVSSEHCNDLVFRTSEHTAMDARAGGRFVAEEGDVSTVAIMHIDDAFGQSVANNWQEVLEAENLEVLDPRGVDAEFTEFEGLFDEAVADGADGVVGGFTAIQLPAFLTTGLGYDVQLFGGFADLLTTQIMADTVESLLGEDFTESDIQDAGLGPFTTRYHWNQFDNPINDAFIDLSSDAYQLAPDLFMSGTFVGASAIVQAIEESGSVDGGDIADAMRGMTVEDTPKGENAYTFQEHNNQAASEMTVAWPVPTSEEYEAIWGASIMPGEPLETLAADEIMVPADEMSCDLS